MTKENKTMDTIHRNILKKFHTLCSVFGLSDAEKRTIIQSFGVESSRDLDTHDLINLCAKLSRQVNEKAGAAEIDKLRKSLIAAIGAYLRATHQSQGISKIKAIACRASGHKDFNKIPRERLRNLIAAFNNKIKDAQAVDDLTDTLRAFRYPKTDDLNYN